jgi:hypothetical protein
VCRDQEDRSSKPAWANSSRDPILKNPSQKRASGVAQGVPEFKPQYRRKRERGEGEERERERMSLKIFYMFSCITNILFCNINTNKNKTCISIPRKKYSISTC